MNAPARVRHDYDLHEEVLPTIVLHFGGLLCGAFPSTMTGLGMRVPVLRGDVETLLSSADAMTNAASLMVEQYWKSHVSTTETGIIHVAAAVPTLEEVRQLRDEVSRRTRLTRQQIARSLGVDRRSLSSWVSGSSVPGAERMERLRLLAELVRDIDSERPGSATEVLLSRRRGRDLLDFIAEGRFDLASKWRHMEPGEPAVRVTTRLARMGKPSLFAAVLAAYREGTLAAPPRAATIRDEADYEQDLSLAETTFPDEPPRPRRGDYR